MFYVYKLSNSTAHDSEIVISFIFVCVHIWDFVWVLQKRQFLMNMFPITHPRCDGKIGLLSLIIWDIKCAKVKVRRQTIFLNGHLEHYLLYEYISYISQQLCSKFLLRSTRSSRRRFELERAASLSGPLGSSHSACLVNTDSTAALCLSFTVHGEWNWNICIL